MGKTLERQSLDHLGKNWSKASLTREKLHGNVREFSRFVEEKYGLEKIENLKPHMVKAYVSALHERGLADSTKADKMTALRVLAESVGKRNIVGRHNSDYGVERVRINPQVVDNERLVEVRQVIAERADQGDPVARMVLAADALRSEFGLRAKESLLSSKVEEKGGKLFLTIEGAKGGRPREMEVRTEGQHYAIQMVSEAAKASGSGTGRMIPPNMSLKQAYDAQRNLWAKCGGTRAVGANMHGERHGYTRARDAEGTAKEQIMVELGHSEDRSPSAYLGKNS